MTYWENGHQVDITTPDHWSPRDIVDDPFPETGKPVDGWWWPSAENPQLHLETLNEEQAARIVEHTRHQLMQWLAGDGPYPARILQRTYDLALLLGITLRGPLAEIYPDRPLPRKKRRPDLDPWDTALWKDRPDPLQTCRDSREALTGLQALRKYTLQPDPRTARDMMTHHLEELSEDTLARIDHERRDSTATIEARTLAALASRRLLQWITEDGHTTPFAAVQRWFALAYERYRDLIGSMSGEDIGNHLLRQTRAAFQEITDRLFVQKSLIRTGVAMKVHGQKPAAASETYAANAKKHKPKQQLHGYAGETTEQRKNESQTQNTRQTDKTAQIIRQARERQIQRDAEEFQRIQERQKAQRIQRQTKN
jgi:hypothetical protein